MESFYKSKYRIPFDQTYYVYLLWLSTISFLFRSVWSVYVCESEQILLMYELLFGLSLVCLMMS
ncbi:hypothetical protein [Reichenbachiella ulvae]|nr:hypothetical protein [Reichenbachiella ulvae]MCV9389535.1 hypothetical protein [Reichenbachiella ulvae]